MLYVRKAVLLAALLALLPGAEAALPQEQAQGHGQMPMQTQFQYQANADGEQALSVGDYARAQSVFQQALSQLSNKQPRQEGYLHLALGEAYLWDGKMPLAGKEFKKANSLISWSGLSSDELCARLLDDLSWYDQTQNKMGKACDEAKQALEIRRKASAPDAFMILNSLAHVAYLFDMQGQLEQAASVYQDALTHAQQNYGPQSLLAADMEEKLAAVCRRLGRSAEAQRCFQHSLAVKLSFNAVMTNYSPHPYWDDIYFRYLDGEPNCSRQFNGGNDTQIVTANGVTVAASLAKAPSAEGKNTPVQISVTNESGAPIQFMPQMPTLTALAPKILVAHLVDPSQLAADVEKKGERKAKWIKFWGENATTSVTNTMIGPQGFWGYPPIYTYGSTPPIINRSGNVTTVTTQVPDYAAQARALQRAQQAVDSSRQTAADIRARALGPTTIAPGASVAGTLYFDMTYPQKSLVEIPVGNAYFEFEFPPR